METRCWAVEHADRAVRDPGTLQHLAAVDVLRRSLDRELAERPVLIAGAAARQPHFLRPAARIQGSRLLGAERHLAAENHDRRGRFELVIHYEPVAGGSETQRSDCRHVRQNGQAKEEPPAHYAKGMYQDSFQNTGGAVKRAYAVGPPATASTMKRTVSDAQHLDDEA